jgi:hypothetical protein
MFPYYLHYKYLRQEFRLQILLLVVFSRKDKIFFLSISLLRHKFQQNSFVVIIQAELFMRVFEARDLVSIKI